MKIPTFSIILLLICVCTSNLWAAFYAGGSGTEEDPYQIASKADLLTLSGTSTDYSKSFILTADIDMQGQVFARAIIAPNSETPFTGIFNGNGHKIMGFTINCTIGSYLGLFGSIGTNGSVKYLGLENISINGTGDNYYVGGLVGYNSGSIISCYVIGTIHGARYVGGLAGFNWYGTLTSCYANCPVTGIGTVGGLVGYNYNGSLTSCHATGIISGIDTDQYFWVGYIGGLVGWSDSNSPIKYCYATGSVTGTDYVGGLVGFYRGTINNCYATGNVQGNECIGGLVGCKDSGSLTTCYATGSAIGTGETSYHVGGLIGYNLSWAPNECYSTGFVSGTYGIGGLVGYGTNTSTTDSFWDIQTSGQSTSSGGIGKTTEDMKTMSTFINSGWWMAGNPDNVLSFDGIDDYIIVPDYYGIGGTNARTVSLWIKTTGDGLTHNLIQWGYPAAGQAWVIMIRSDGKVSVSASNGGVYSTSSVTNNRWHHIAVVLDEGQADSSQIHLYIDGILESTPTGSCIINTGQTVPVHIGVVKNFNTGDLLNYFKGLMDDVCIYERALDPNEIIPEVPTPTEGLVARWTMDETYGTVAHNSVSSYEGFLNNMTFTEGEWAVCEGTSYPRLRWQIPAGDWICPEGINIEDLEYFIEQWLMNNCSPDNNNCSGVDLDNSGFVDMNDLSMVALHWLE